MSPAVRVGALMTVLLVVVVLLVSVVWAQMRALEAARDAMASKAGAEGPAHHAAASPAATPTHEEDDEEDADEAEEEEGHAIGVSFDEDPVGKLPAAWSQGVQKGMTPGDWRVMACADAPSKPNVLAQVKPVEQGGAYPVAWLKAPSLKDGEIGVKFKPISGTVDQAAGIIFRAKDANNYYVVRANALEGNVRLYHVVNGKRTQLASADVKVESNKWQELEVAFRGSEFKVELDGKALFEATDGTITDAGKIGLWTKADSVTYFDDLRCESGEQEAED